MSSKAEPVAVVVKRKVGRPRLPSDEKRKRKNEYCRAVYHRYSDKRKERVMCECGMSVSRVGLTDHRRRRLHKNNMELIERLKAKVCVPVPKEQ